jgi:hypothetical protein
MGTVKMEIVNGQYKSYLALAGTPGSDSKKLMVLPWLELSLFLTANG